MTAMNAFARPSGAHIIADTGAYSTLGNMVETYRKVSQSNALRFLIGHSGQPGPNCCANIDHWIQTRSSQQMVIDGVADLLRDLEADAEDARHAAARCDARARARGMPEEEFEPPAPIGMRLTLAWWDFSQERGRAAIIGSVDGMAGPESEAFELRRIGTIFTPALPFDRWPGHSFEPESDADELAAVQRSIADDNGIFRVGGAFEHYRANRKGIAKAIIKDWLDPIGRPITQKGA